MTTNQIDYYNARMKAKNDRLTRKEQKRHNLAQEGAQNLSAQAAVSSANAAQSQAATANKRYQLEWESEYGFPYGTDRETMNNQSNWRKTSEVYGDTEPAMPQGPVTQTYAKSQFQIIKDIESSKTEYSKRLSNIGKTAKDIADAAGKTYYIISEVTGQ